MRATALSNAPTIPLASAAERARLSAPALRGFLGVAARWALDEETQLALLGWPARSTFYSWKQAVSCARRAGGAGRRGLVLPADTLTRIAHLADVFASLEEWLGAAPEEADGWVHASNAEPPFHGMTPLAFMREGGLPALAATGGYLAALLGGPR